MSDGLNRNAQLLKYFAQQHRGILRKRLAKMLYMSDVIARQSIGHPISALQWRADQFGPYASEIRGVIEELESAGLVWTRDTVDKETHHTEKKLFDSGHRIIFDFSPAEDAVLAYVVENYLRMPMEELLFDVVYQTAPYKAHERFHELLNMDMVNDEARRLAGFDLDALIAAERQADSGDFLTAREYFSGLQNRIAARYAESD